MSSPIFNPVPDPVADVASISVAVRAMKVLLEMITGQQGMYAFSSSRISAAPPDPVKAGDLWVDSSNGNKLRVWDGTRWASVTL